MHISDHLDPAQPQWIAVFQLAPEYGSGDIVPLHPSMSLKHALEGNDHIVCLNILELLLQFRLHVSEHEAAYFCRLIPSLTVGGFHGSRLIVSQLIRNWIVQDMFLLLLLENNS